MSDKNLCPQPAAVRYYWPGRDEACACVRHAGAIRTVANAMGLHLPMIQLSEAVLLLALTCSSQDDLPEEIENV